MVDGIGGFDGAANVDGHGLGVASFADYQMAELMGRDGALARIVMDSMTEMEVRARGQVLWCSAPLPTV